MPATLMIAPDAVLPGMSAGRSRGPAIRCVCAHPCRVARTAVGNPIETLDGKTDVGEVLQQQPVAVEFSLDRFEHVHLASIVAADEADEVAVAVERGPDAGTLADAHLATTTRHGHRKHSAVEYGLLDLGDHLQVVRRLRQMERERELRLAEKAEFMFGFRVPLRVDDDGQFADVVSGRRQSSVPHPGAALRAWAERSGLARPADAIAPPKKTPAPRARARRAAGSKARVCSAPAFQATRRRWLS